jgi:beta-fructofuranosidase
MLTPRGFLPGELGDAEAVADGAALHLFYLVTPNCCTVRHAVSTDGLSWTELPAALQVGTPGAFDDDRIWTVSVTRHDQRWYMHYTALAQHDDGHMQRIGLAISEDLVQWDKWAQSPVCVPDARWYEADAADERWVSWRDPKVACIDQRFYLTLCAKQSGGPLTRRGVVGLCSSEDLLSWQGEPPLFAPQQYFELECPQLFQIGSRFYLTAAVLDDRSQRYWIADQLQGPYRTPPDNRLLPAGHYAARVFRWGEQDALICWHQPQAAADDADTKRVLSPLSLAQRADGTLVCRPWPAWRSYAGEPRTIDLQRLQPQLDNPTSEQRSQGVAVAQGMQLWSFDTGDTDYLVRTRVVDAVALWGIGIALDPDGMGWYVELEPGLLRARLLRLVRRRDCGYLVCTREVRQEAPLPATAGYSRELVLRQVAGEIELAVDGQVVLSSWIDRSASTGPALFAVSGELEIEELTITPMRRP